MIFISDYEYYLNFSHLFFNIYNLYYITTNLLNRDQLKDQTFSISTKINLDTSLEIIIIQYLNISIIIKSVTDLIIIKSVAKLIFKLDSKSISKISD